MTMPTSDARREEVDGVVTVTFTRDDKRNAMSSEIFAVIRDAARDLGDRDDLKVLVITAEGRYFTSGFDIANLRTNVGEGTDGVVRGSNMRRQYRAEAYHDLFDELEQIEKPIILAAQANCFGAGIEMGASCDFRLAADTAEFCLPEVANIATMPGSGGISRLTRLIGPSWAKWLVMAGERITAEQALAIGLVQAVYPAAEFGARVDEFAHRLAGMPREAMGLAKTSIAIADSVDRRSAREFDRLAQSLLFQSHEFRDRVDAFNQASASRNEAKPT